MTRNFVYYLIGGLLAALFAAYIAYYIAFLIIKVSAVSEKTLPNTSEVATFNLEKFSELKILR